MTPRTQMQIGGQMQMRGGMGKPQLSQLQMPGQLGTPRIGAARMQWTPRTSGPSGLANAGSMLVRGPSKKAHASLGVLRLDYDYPPAPGDIDSPDSFAYDVYYR